VGVEELVDLDLEHGLRLHHPVPLLVGHKETMPWPGAKTSTETLEKFENDARVSVASVAPTHITF
jgi:hypothetical protein